MALKETLISIISGKKKINFVLRKNDDVIVYFDPLNRGNLIFLDHSSKGNFEQQ